MKATYLHTLLNQAIARRDVFLCLTILLTLVVLMLSVTVYRQVGNTRVVLVPSTMHQVGWLDKRDVSDAYLTDMARYMSDLFLNATAENSDYRMTNILRFTAPDDKGALNAELMLQKEKLAKEDISTVFFPSSFAREGEQFVVLVQGSLHRYVGDKALAPLPKTYRIEFVYQNGLLLVSQFHEVVKNA